MSITQSAPRGSNFSDDLNALAGRGQEVPPEEPDEAFDQEFEVEGEDLPPEPALQVAPQPVAEPAAPKRPRGRPPP